MEIKNLLLLVGLGAEASKFSLPTLCSECLGGKAVCSIEYLLVKS